MSPPARRVTVVGSGYVGLVTGACLAHGGHDVTCVDTDAGRVEAINAGRAPFFEPGLDAVLGQALGAGRLRARSDLDQAVAASHVSIIAVGTPSVDGRIDLGAVEAAAAAIGRLLPGAGAGHTVVLKSTCVPGTADGVVGPILEAESGMKAGDFGLCTNPEFLREGSAVDDFMTPDRIVIGQRDAASGDALEALYAGFDCPKMRTSLRDAEMIKYASNALLATLISFSNEVAALCEGVPGLDEAEVMRGLHLDRRLAPMVGDERIRPGILAYLRAGIGYGGSCLPKDTRALGAFAAGLGIETPLLDAVIRTNDGRAGRVVALLEGALGGLAGASVAVLGLAFKPHTDDVRESPGLAMIEALRRRGAEVRGWDPIAVEAARQVLGPDIELTDDLAGAVAGADAALIATAWPQCAAFDWTAALPKMKRPVILDGRGLLDAARLPPEAVYLRIGAYPGGG